MDQVIKRAKILVMGVGGGGCNAVKSMIEAGVTSADFVAVNTDGQALSLSPAEKKIAIGLNTTKGLGAGSRPEVGKGAAEESRDQIRECLNDVDMLFITAGMGGGTGTGAAPVIASIAKEKKILTVAVVTKPFGFEAHVRNKNAEAGIEQLRSVVDTLIVIPNDNLAKVLGADATMLNAFKHADSVLKDAISGITDLIATPSMINLDFADVKTIMQDKGQAHLSIGVGEGNEKIAKAVRAAVMSPLLNTNISGATGVLLYIIGGPTLGIGEVTEACDQIKKYVSPNAHIIFGTGLEEDYGDKVKVLLVATGFEDSKKTSTFGRSYAPKEGGILTNEEFDQKFGASPMSAFNQNNARMGGYTPVPSPTYTAQPVQQPQQQYAPQQPQQTVAQPQQPQQERQLPSWLRGNNRRI